MKAAYNQGMQDGSIAGFNKYSLNPETKQKDDRLALEKLKGQSDLMKADLDNWQVQWGLITANLDEWKAAFSAKANQLDSCQRELGAKAEEVGSLKATTLELESKFNTLNFDFNSLDRLYTKLAAERLAKNEAMKTWDEELEEIETSGRRARMDELENKDAQLYDAKKQIKELNQILLAASSQLPQSPPPAPASSPPYEASPGSKAASPPNLSTSPAKGSRGDRGETKFSPCRLLIFLFIFLVTILVPYLHSQSQQSWEAVSEVIDPGSQDDRIRWEAWAFR